MALLAFKLFKYVTFTTFRLTKELSDDAQRWAEKLAEMDKLNYRQNSKYGENLYCLWSSDRGALPNAKEVCK